MNNIRAKTVALISILAGLGSAGRSAYYLYQYNFTDKLWFYMFTTSHLVTGIILGLIAIVNGIILLKHSRKINFYIAIICVVAILCLWFLIR